MSAGGQRARREGLWLLAVVILCAVAVAPLLHSASPCTHDGDFHYFRVVAIRHALEQGIVYSRWLPDLAFGYGYPFFNYREPLSYYLPLLLWLLGLPLPLALNLVYVLSIIGCAVGAYLLARDLWGPGAGVVAAVAYAYAPYQFLDALVRGNAPESVALALFPIILWTFRRLVVDGRRRWFLAAVASLVALYLTHNISSLTFTPVLGVYVLLLGWAYRRRGRWGWAIVAIGLALALTAFLWFPALAEKGFAQLHMSRTTRNNDFHYNFVGLAEIFASPAPADTSLLNPPMEIHLGLVQAVLGVVGAGLQVCKFASGEDGPEDEGRRAMGRERGASLAFFVVLTVLFLWLSTLASLWLWESIPLLSFVQFPWRFVGRAALPVSLLAGALFSTHKSPGSKFPLATCHLRLATWDLSKNLLACLAVTALILVAFPATYPPHGLCPQASHPTVVDIHRYERESRLVGVDPEGSYFPVWVEQRPEGSPLEAQYVAGGPIERFDATALPAGASILSSNYGPNRATIVVDAPRPFRARYLSFYFPGWRAWIDGDPVEISPADPSGLIEFDMPAGQHTVVIRFGETPLRLAADALSVLSLLAFVILLLRPLPLYSSPCLPLSPSPRLLVTLSPCLLALLSLALLVLKLAVVDRSETLFRRPLLQPGAVLPAIDHPLDRAYADGMTLLGYSLSASSLPADGSLRVDLYWSVRQPPAGRYQATVYLADAAGFLWSPRDSYRPRGYHRPPPTTTWQPGQYALDSHEIEPLAGTPPGTYRLVVVLFDRDSLAPLSVLDAQGQPAAPELTLAQVTLTRPRQPAEPPARNRIDRPLGALTLLSADFDRAEAAPGDPVYLTLFWRAEAAVDAAPAAPLELQTAEGRAVVSYELSPPVDAWQAGDVWRSQHRLLLPADLTGGSYRWAVQGSAVGVLQLHAPQHLWQAPPLDLEAETSFSALATLLGAQVAPQLASCDLQLATCNLRPGASLTVTLVWRAEATAAESYHVFVHLLGPDGRLVAQSDGIPAGWSRPTTGWLRGEIIVDPHTLTLPADAAPGDYVLQAGLYLPGGDRLTTADGTDAARIVTIQVTEP